MKRTLSPLLLTLPLAILLLSGCAGLYPPNYRAYSNGAGFSEAQVSKDTWEVEYVGPEALTELQAKQMALLRAAELTRYAGRRWFSIVSAETASRKVHKTSREVTKTPLQDSGVARADAPQVVQETTTREDAWIPSANVVIRIEAAETEAALDAEQVWAQGKASGLLPNRKG